MEQSKCPFCGNTPKEYYPNIPWIVNCKTKGCPLEDKPFDDKKGKYNWNTRPIEDALRTENERLKVMLDEAIKVMAYCETCIGCVDYGDCKNPDCNEDNGYCEEHIRLELARRVKDNQ